MRLGRKYLQTDIYGFFKQRQVVPTFLLKRRNGFQTNRMIKQNALTNIWTNGPSGCNNSTNTDPEMLRIWLAINEIQRVVPLISYIADI